MSLIESLHGQLDAIGEDYFVLRVGGVGLRVYVPLGAQNQVAGVGQPVSLLTHLVVREDSLTLYGFTEQGERAIFEALLSVSGIGPRLAMAAVSSLSEHMIHQAIQNNEPEILARVSGIGKKTAQRIVIDLKDKLKFGEFAAEVAPVSDADTDVIEALTTLGYSLVEAQMALQSLPKDAPPDVEARVLLALQYFG